MPRRFAFVVVGILAVLAVVPFFVRADHTLPHTLEQIQAQFAALSVQIRTLERQVGGLSGTTVPAPPTSEGVRSCPALRRNLLLGSTDASANGEVSSLQRYLAADPTIYPEGLVTGFFGQATERAVRRFQERHTIVASGTPSTTGYGAVGERTREQILERCSSAGTPPVVVAPLATSSPSGSPPDLAVVSLGTLEATTTVPVNTNVRIRATVRNLGGVASTTSVGRYAFRFGSADGPVVIPETPYRIASLAPGADHIFNGVFTFFAPGRYFLRLCADAAAGETATANNCGMYTIPVDVPDESQSATSSSSLLSRSTTSTVPAVCPTSYALVSLTPTSTPATHAGIATVTISGRDPQRGYVVSISGAVTGSTGTLFWNDFQGDHCRSRHTVAFRAGNETGSVDVGLNFIGRIGSERFTVHAAPGALPSAVQATPAVLSPPQILPPAAAAVPPAVTPASPVIGESPYKGVVEIAQIGRSSSLRSDQEYLSIRRRTESSAGAPARPVNVSGWEIRSRRSFARIPRAFNVPEFDASEQDILLPPGGELIVVTGSPSYPQNFRENSCIGYLNESHSFIPSLPGLCADRPLERSLLFRQGLTGACIDAIEATPACRIPRGPFSPGVIGQNCIEFLGRNLSYSACVRDFRGARDFLRNTWRAVLRRPDLLYDSRRDHVFLYDGQGLLVDDYEY